MYLQVMLGSPHGTPGLAGGLHGRSSISGQPPPIRPIAALPVPAAAKDPLLDAEWYWGDITREEVRCSLMYPLRCGSCKFTFETDSRCDNNRIELNPFIYTFVYVPVPVPVMQHIFLNSSHIWTTAVSDFLVAMYRYFKFQLSESKKFFSFYCN
jgi:hypothetical protein